MKSASIAGVLLALGSICAAAQNVTHLAVSQPEAAPGAALQGASPPATAPVETAQVETAQVDLPKVMKPPELSYAQVDWPAALASLADVEALGPTVLANRTRLPGTRNSHPALARLNAVMSAHFAALTSSPVPVLLPFDVAARLRDQAEGHVAEDDRRYLAGFHAARFFYPGPAGYDAAFAIRPSDIPELADAKFSEPVVVLISGSALLYEIDMPPSAAGQPVATLESEFPGIRKTILEHHLRYTFVRYGVPYSVSVGCFDTASVRHKVPSCRTADQVAQRFLRALRVVGGSPRPLRAAKPWPIERPHKASPTFGYYAPGQIQSGTGFRNKGGRQDYTVYSQIRFPLAEAPAYAGSERYHRGPKTRIADPNDIQPAQIAQNPWRDNFCERRGFSVSQCPTGIGHQGQDLRPLICRPAPNSDRCDPPGDVVAARGGVILRAPKQEAAYLFVNSANEHIRFRYLHMSPRKMDADNLLSGRRVYEGEVIGEVGNYSMRENGTSYHLHFDIQVPTRHGWVLVNPYMTLVAAYERLIGERGTELVDPSVVANADGTVTGSAGNAETERAEPPRRKKPNWAKNKRNKAKWRRYAGR
ncbi:MAG: M23 family metallopeptidase [Xanthobacteraceae bacterium]|nr:M23 family metallopeptidase [Xanthobacteraceae bacterium]